MEKTIAAKLRIKPGYEVLFANATADQRALLDPLPENVTTTEAVEDGTSDVAVLFALDRATLDEGEARRGAATSR